MKNQIAGVIAAAALFAAPAAHAVEVVKTENSKVDVGARLQVMGFGQYLDDTTRSDARAYMFLKQSRFTLGTDYNDFKFRLMVAVGGEDEIKAPTPGIALGLMDLYVDIPVMKNTYVRAGQFKVPYSRERLTDSTNLFFADRSINNTAFKLGRDAGAAIHTNYGKVAAGAGVFTGGGRNIPERYLPERLGVPLLAARIGYVSNGAENVFAEPSDVREVGATQYAFFVNGTYTKDSLVGHSTVLNTKPSERSLIINANWNPYIGAQPLDPGKQWQVGADAELKTPVGPGTLGGEAEVNFAVFQNNGGDIRVPGGRAQLSYTYGQFDVAARYALFMPDTNFRTGGLKVTNDHGIQEFTPAISYRMPKFNAKIVADLPVHINTPVVNEPGVGAYALMDMPDQAALVKTKSAPVTRQDVIEGRLMLQAVF